MHTVCVARVLDNVGQGELGLRCLHERTVAVCAEFKFREPVCETDVGFGFLGQL